MKYPSKRTTIDVIRGLLCCLKEDPTGHRCWNCAYDCSNGTPRGKIIHDAEKLLSYCDGKRFPEKPGK